MPRLFCILDERLSPFLSASCSLNLPQSRVHVWPSAPFLRPPPCTILTPDRPPRPANLVLRAPFSAPHAPQPYGAWAYVWLPRIGRRGSGPPPGFGRKFASFVFAPGSPPLAAARSSPAGNAGAHTVSNGVTLTSTGTQTITATDTSSPSVTGNASVTVNSSAPTGALATTGTSGSTDPLDRQFGSPLVRSDAQLAQLGS
jgi:hypothetical protein